MKKLLTRNHYHLLVLFIILSIGVYAFTAVANDRLLQRTIGILTAVVYVTWGLLHHALGGDLYRKIVVEYVLIGAFAIIVILTVTGY